MFSPQEASIQSEILRSKIFKQNASEASILLVYYINFLAVRTTSVRSDWSARPPLCAGALVRGERQLLSGVPFHAEAIFTAELLTRHFESPRKIYGEILR